MNLFIVYSFAPSDLEVFSAPVPFTTPVVTSIYKREFMITVMSNDPSALGNKNIFKSTNL